jgi:hypothetical protein
MSIEVAGVGYLRFKRNQRNRTNEERSSEDEDTSNQTQWFLIELERNKSIRKMQREEDKVTNWVVHSTTCVNSTHDHYQEHQSNTLMKRSVNWSDSSSFCSDRRTRLLILSHVGSDKALRHQLFPAIVVSLSRFMTVKHDSHDHDHWGTHSFLTESTHERTRQGIDCSC